MKYKETFFGYIFPVIGFLILVVFLTLTLFSCEESMKPVPESFKPAPTEPDSVGTKCSKCGHQQFIYVYKITKE